MGTFTELIAHKANNEYPLSYKPDEHVPLWPLIGLVISFELSVFRDALSLKRRPAAVGAILMVRLLRPLWLLHRLGTNDECSVCREVPEQLTLVMDPDLMFNTFSYDVRSYC
jgi:hypothetical protein